MEMAPLSIQEASPDVSEIQSPTLMMQGVLSETEGEAVEVPNFVEEKEDSSSTGGPLA